MTRYPCGRTDECGIDDITCLECYLNPETHISFTEKERRVLAVALRHLWRDTVRYLESEGFDKEEMLSIPKDIWRKLGLPHEELMRPYLSEGLTIEELLHDRRMDR